MSIFDFAITEISDFYGVGQKTPYAWFKQGCPGRTGRGRADLKAIYQWRKQKEKEERADQDLEESKKRYWAAKSEREELAAAKEKGDLCPRVDIESAWVSRALEHKSGMFMLENSLPPLLAGKSEREMAAIIYQELWSLFDRLYRTGTFTPATAGVSYQTPLPKHRTILTPPKNEENENG